MEINGINMQITQGGSSQPLTGSGDTAGLLKSRQSTLADSASSNGSQANSQLNSLTSGSYIKDQIETIMFSFPPFFPVGSPQRLDLIKGVKVVQDEIKSSQLPTVVKEKLAGQELTDTATDKEISTALEGVQQYTEGYSPTPSQSAGNGQQANIVSVKI
jgi:hypothetical protein